MPKDKVLLVDDEPDFIKFLSARMKARGVDVETAQNGEEALSKVKAKNYDVIFLDLAMPGLDGIQTLKQLREVNSEVQIIMLSGHGNVRKTVEALKLGAVDFLEKPADIEDIMSKIIEASAQKALLVQKRVDEQLTDILRKKGW